MSISTGLPVRFRTSRRGLSVSYFGSSAGSSLTYTTNLLFRVQSDTGTSTTTPGAGVSQWDDQAVGARHYAQATGASQPLYRASGPNGQPYLEFDGTDDLMTTSAFGSGISQPLTDFFVIRQNSWTLADRVSDSGTDELVLRQQSSSPEVAIYAGGAFDCTNSGLTVGQWGVLEIIWNGASSQIQVNGGTATTGNPGSGGLTAARTRSIGGHNGAPPPITAAHIDVAAHLSYSEATSNGNRSTVRAYLGSKYGITVA